MVPGLLIGKEEKKYGSDVESFKCLTFDNVSVLQVLNLFVSFSTLQVHFPSSCLLQFIFVQWFALVICSILKLRKQLV